MIVANLEAKSDKSATNCRYLDSSATKHILGNESNFTCLEDIVKIQNVKSVRGQIHGVYGKGKVKLSSTFGEIKSIIDVFNVQFLMNFFFLVGMFTYKSNKLIFDLKNCLVVHDQNLNMVVAKMDVKNGLNTNLKLILSNSSKFMKAFVVERTSILLTSTMVKLHYGTREWQIFITKLYAQQT
jgi:hypothetical protein